MVNTKNKNVANAYPTGTKESLVSFTEVFEQILVALCMNYELITINHSIFFISEMV